MNYNKNKNSFYKWKKNKIWRHIKGIRVFKNSISVNGSSILPFFQNKNQSDFL